MDVPAVGKCNLAGNEQTKPNAAFAFITGAPTNQRFKYMGQSGWLNLRTTVADAELHFRRLSEENHSQRCTLQSVFEPIDHQVAKQLLQALWVPSSFNIPCDLSLYLTARMRSQ